MKQLQKEEDIRKLVQFAEQQQKRKHNLDTSNINNRLYHEEMELNRLKLKHNIKQKTKKRKAAKVQDKVNKKLPLSLQASLQYCSTLCNNGEYRGDIS